MPAFEPPATQGSSRRWRGIAITIGTLAVLRLLDEAGHRVSNPAPIYLLALVAAASDGGKRVGLASAAITVGYSLWLSSSPGGVFALTHGDLQLVATLTIVTPLVAVMVGGLRDNAAQMAASDREALLLRQRLADRAREEVLLRTALLERESLLLELGHRVGNAMQTVSGLVNLAEREVAASAGRDPQAPKHALDVLAQRVRQLNLVHVMQHNPNAVSVGAKKRGSAVSVDATIYLTAVAQRSQMDYGADIFTGMRLNLEPMQLLVIEAAPLGLLLHEALTNAFASIANTDEDATAARPELTVDLHEAPGGMTKLIVDNNCRAVVTPTPGTMRARLMAALVRQLGGVIENDAASAGPLGTRFCVQVPLTRVLSTA